MAFPAPPGVDKDTDGIPADSVALDEVIDTASDGELGHEPIARSHADGGARGRVGDALADDVLIDATGEGHLELATAGVRAVIRSGTLPHNHPK